MLAKLVLNSQPQMIHWPQPPKVLGLEAWATVTSLVSPFVNKETAQRQGMPCPILGFLESPGPDSALSSCEHAERDMLGDLRSQISSIWLFSFLPYCSYLGWGMVLAFNFAYFSLWEVNHSQQLHKTPPHPITKNHCNLWQCSKHKLTIGQSKMLDYSLWLTILNFFWIYQRRGRNNQDEQ